MYAPVLVTPPETLPVSLEEAKLHLRVDVADDDALIAGLIGAATGHLDGWQGVLGRALEPQTWEMSLDAFPHREIRIPLGPVASVESVTYAGLDGVSQTVAAEDYELDLKPVEGWIVPNTAWPAAMSTVNAVTVRWVAGTGCPLPVKQAILLLVGHWYEHRESAGATLSALPMAVDALIAPLRRFSI